MIRHLFIKMLFLSAKSWSCSFTFMLLIVGVKHYFFRVVKTAAVSGVKTPLKGPILSLKLR